MNVALLAALVLLSQASTADQSKTVIGPRNIQLADGADALMAGDGEEGVRLTLLGLEAAHGSYEAKIAHANLCAGFLLIEQPQTALKHCNWVLERHESHWRTYNNRALVYLRLQRYQEAEDDIRKGQELRPNSRKLKIVKGLYLDETQPVTPKIEIDDRRNPDAASSTEPPNESSE
jgi:tetratricopeptide (TPR) repeat protein